MISLMGIFNCGSYPDPDLDQDLDPDPDQDRNPDPDQD